MIKRLEAKKTRVSDILSGKFFPGSKEEMKPNYIITPFGQKISRVSLVASVIDKFMSDDGGYSTITIDDGTEAISVKTFKDGVSLLNEINLGDIVMVIGKVKEYNGEIYVNGEIVRKVNANFENLRKLEILNELIEQKKIAEEIKNLQDKMSIEELENYAKEKFGIDREALEFIQENLKIVKEVDYKPKMIELIESLDEGDGVEISKLLELSDLPENQIEGAITDLLASGALFEPRPGVLKKV